MSEQKDEEYTYPPSVPVEDYPEDHGMRDECGLAFNRYMPTDEATDEQLELGARLCEQRAENWRQRAAEYRNYALYRVLHSKPTAEELREAFERIVKGRIDAALNGGILFGEAEDLCVRATRAFQDALAQRNCRTEYELAEKAPVVLACRCADLEVANRITEALGPKPALVRHNKVGSLPPYS